MGGALMELVAKGSQDIFLTGNPSVTYFRSVYKRHTNFSHESIIQSFQGQLDFGKKIECVISRSGDLLSYIVLEIDLPKMEGKRGKDIRWVNSIGHHIIQDVELQIGGQTIDKQYGEWLEIWSELTLDESKKQGYNNMVGKDIQITDEKTLIIPLQFWFCRHYGLALPLVALQYHEVRVIVTLAPFSECWHYEFDTYYLTKTNDKVTIDKSNQTNVESLFPDSSGIYLDGEDDYYNMRLIWEDGNEDIVQNRSIGDNQSLELKSNSLIGNKSTPQYAYLVKEEPKEDYKLGDARLYCEYIFLDTGERKFFAQTKHLYLIEQIQTNGVNSYTKGQENNKIPLEFNHPCKELIWVNGLDFNKKVNGHFNFSNNVNEKYGKDPLDNAVLHINGEERFRSRKADYFRYLVPYQRHTRVPNNFIYVYSFGIKPEDNQPSGSCNFSRLNTSEFIMNFKKGIDNLTTRIYAINYNLLNIHNGMGGLAYSN